MFDVDSFEHILAIVRTCVAANRADLIEGALIDRQHVSAVMAKIEAERTAHPAPAASRALFGEPDPATRDALAEAVRKRSAAAGRPGTVLAQQTQAAHPPIIGYLLSVPLRDNRVFPEIVAEL